jgi:hypothetical protein
MGRLRRGVLLLASGVFATGCGSASTPEPTFTVRDSAGIEIVESSAPLLGPEAWTISEEPVLQIGQVEGEDPYLFAGINPRGNGDFPYVFRWTMGRIVVCNGMDSTIRIFDRLGDFVRMVGGEGEGPGEYSFIEACWPIPSGMVVAADNYLSFLNLEGTVVRKVLIPSVNGGRAFPHGVFEDGSYFVIRRHETPSSDGVHDATAGVFVIDAAGEPGSEFLTMKQDRRIQQGRYSITQQFGPIGSITGAADGIFYGWPETYSISEFDAQGVLQAVISRAWDPLPVTEEDVAGWLSFRDTLTEFQGSDSPDLREAYRKQTSIMVFPEHRAPFDEMHVDRIGHLWVRNTHPRYDRIYASFGVRFPFEWTWDVFDPQGRWLTTVTLPAAFRAHDIGEDYILGVWRDELDVEYVRMYSLDRGG